MFRPYGRRHRPLGAVWLAASPDKTELVASSAALAADLLLGITAFYYVLIAIGALGTRFVPDWMPQPATVQTLLGITAAGLSISVCFVLGYIVVIWLYCRARPELATPSEPLRVIQAGRPPTPMLADTCTDEPGTRSRGICMTCSRRSASPSISLSCAQCTKSTNSSPPSRIA